MADIAMQTERRKPFGGCKIYSVSQNPSCVIHNPVGTPPANSTHHPTNVAPTSRQPPPLRHQPAEHRLHVRKHGRRTCASLLPLAWWLSLLAIEGACGFIEQTTPRMQPLCPVAVPAAAAYACWDSAVLAFLLSFSTIRPTSIRP